jgi:hypothetical protein
MRKSVLLVVTLMLVLALPAFAGARTIQSGIDLWMTTGDGSTYADFTQLPIPAGFFCAGSEPFQGKVAMRGVPIVTGEAGALGVTDTIIQRFDNAAFNKRGVAVTRIQVRAMTFESMAPLKTACGAYKVRLSLNGPQPITQMRIVREDEHGGRFFAPISVNIKLNFVPIGREDGEVLEITREVRFPPSKTGYWSDLGVGRSTGHPETVQIDTDGDLVADTYVPGTSNFVAGRGSRGQKASACHTADEGVHCPILIPDESIE